MTLFIQAVDAAIQDVFSKELNDSRLTISINHSGSELYVYTVPTFSQRISIIDKNGDILIFRWGHQATFQMNDPRLLDFIIQFIRQEIPITLIERISSVVEDAIVWISNKI